MTTGAPGTPASVTNVGTTRNAILNFTIPQAEAGPEQPNVTSTLSALTAVNDTAQTPAAAGAPLTFPVTQFESGTGISSAGRAAGTFTLAEAGTYEISYNTTVSNSAGGAVPVTPGVSLTSNSAPIPGATASATITASGDTAALAGTTLISVAEGTPAIIALIANDTGGSYANTSITIRKLA